MEALRPTSRLRCASVLNPAALYWKNDSGARDLEQLADSHRGRLRRSARARLQVREAGLDFVAPLARRAEDRLVLRPDRQPRAACALPAAGARVLDVCSYVGAWAVTALKHGAGQRHLRRLLAGGAGLRAAQCRAPTGYTLETMRGDAFDALKALHEQGARFDVVILDPPAFIKRKKDIPQGQAAYRKLNQLALGLIERDGLLVSCSCSYHLAAERAGERDPGRGPPYRALRPDARVWRPVARPPGASGHPRNPLPEGVLLPRHARVSAKLQLPHAAVSRLQSRSPSRSARSRSTGTASCT